MDKKKEHGLTLKDWGIPYWIVLTILGFQLAGTIGLFTHTETVLMVMGLVTSGVLISAGIGLGLFHRWGVYVSMVMFGLTVIMGFFADRGLIDRLDMMIATLGVVACFQLLGSEPKKIDGDKTKVTLKEWPKTFIPEALKSFGLLILATLIAIIPSVAFKPGLGVIYLLGFVYAGFWTFGQRILYDTIIFRHPGEKKPWLQTFMYALVPISTGWITNYIMRIMFVAADLL